MKPAVAAALFCLAIARTAAAGDMQFAAPAATTIWDPAPSTRCLDLVILAEGYTASEQAQFNADAAALAGHLLSVEPWKSRQDMIRIHRVNVISRESGTDAPPSNPYRMVDTAFDSGY